MFKNNKFNPWWNTKSIALYGAIFVATFLICKLWKEVGYLQNNESSRKARSRMVCLLSILEMVMIKLKKP